MVFDTFDRTGSAEFPFPKLVVFRALCTAVQGLKGMNIEHRDELACRLDIKTGMSALSWGEKVSVSVVEKGSNTAAVSVQSAAKTVFGSDTTHGKNRENVKRIINETSKILSQHGPEWCDEMGLNSIASSSPPMRHPTGSVADELLKLASLRDQGILSPAEFNAEKLRLLK